MLRLFNQIRQITFEPHLLYEALAQFRIKRIFGLAQIFSLLSCRATERHLLYSPVRDAMWIELRLNPNIRRAVRYGICFRINLLNIHRMYLRQIIGFMNINSANVRSLRDRLVASYNSQTIVYNL